MSLWLVSYQVSKAEIVTKSKSVVLSKLQEKQETEEKRKFVTEQETFNYVQFVFSFW
jgi:hypothetical protein